MGLHSQVHTSNTREYHLGVHLRLIGVDRLHTDYWLLCNIYGNNVNDVDSTIKEKMN